jgi:hypothetical protein
MARLRFNHMELTVPKGHLDSNRDRIKAFYGEVFGFEALDVPILGQTGLLLRTDPETSQFILITEQTRHLLAPGYDHLGFLYESRDEVEALHETCKKWQARHPEIEIKEYDDLIVGDTTVRAFYVRHLLPLWFDVQTIEFAEGAAPDRAWRYS